MRSTRLEGTVPSSTEPPRLRRAPSALRYLVPALVAATLSAVLGTTSCLDRPLCDVDCRPRTTNLFVDTMRQTSVDKIDLLFMIDNSSSMADKQDVMKKAVPALVQRLVSPNCVDSKGVRVGTTPVDPAADCPSGVREFKPIRNIHVGIITSSLGDHGGGSGCVGHDSVTDLTDQEQNDHAHLIGSRPRFAPALAAIATGSANASAVSVQQPEPPGYLDWNPGGDKPVGQDVSAFNSTFQVMVTAVGESGCGFEAQLESIYRFLADPVPPQTLQKTPCGTQQCVTPGAIDSVLLQQREAFLRPDSLVAVIMVTDENDCSIRDGGDAYYAADVDRGFHLPHGSAVCTTNPNDPCCYSCGSAPPKACPHDPTCDRTATTSPLASSENDAHNLRCFHQKQRFGYDFLYPTQRYVNALSKPQLCISVPDLAFDPTNPSTCPGGSANIRPNPLFSDLTGGNALSRDPSLVFFAGIVGVPWQDLQATTNPLTRKAYPGGELHYKTAAQLEDDKIWDYIVGDTSASPPRPPSDGLMIESQRERTGSNDFLGNPIPGPQAPPAQYNAINRHEWNDSNVDDLMYACVFPLPTPRACTNTAGVFCDCDNSAGQFNPLCQNPADNTYGTTQYYAKGYPGTRELQVLRDFAAVNPSKNSIVASICPRSLDTPTAQAYGYQPAVDAIVDRLKEALSNRCLPRKLVPNASGDIPCSIIEVRPIDQGNDCDAIPGRHTPTNTKQAALDRLRETGVCDAGGASPSCKKFLLCEIDALPSGSECHTDHPQPPSEVGWCYVDPSVNPKDSPSLVANCAANEQRIVRFVGDATPAHGAQVLIACFGAPVEDAVTGATPATRTDAGG